MAAVQAACTVSNQSGEKSNEVEISLSLQTVKVIVEMGVDVNAVTGGDVTAMHMAAFAGADAVVQYLAEQGAEINIKNDAGETPWSMASGISPDLEDRGAYSIHESTAALLLELGAGRVSREEMDVPVSIQILTIKRSVLN